MWTKPELRTSCSFRTHCDHRCFAAWLDDSNKNTLSFSINSVINIHCANFSVCAHTYHLKLLVLLKLNYVFRGNIKQHPKTTGRPLSSQIKAGLRWSYVKASGDTVCNTIRHDGFGIGLLIEGHTDFCALANTTHFQTLRWYSELCVPPSTWHCLASFDQNV